VDSLHGERALPFVFCARLCEKRRKLSLIFKDPAVKFKVIPRKLQLLRVNLQVHRAILQDGPSKLQLHSGK
jgi:hypothetical protein